MTQDEKAKRRTYIQESAESTRAAKEMTYWLTRDKDIDGNLDTKIDVWLAQPKLHVLPGGVGIVWVCDAIVATATGDCPARYTQWTTDQCLRACRVYPETERECIKVG